MQVFKLNQQVQIKKCLSIQQLAKLNIDSRLRGCIGYIRAQRNPLAGYAGYSDFYHVEVEETPGVTKLWDIAAEFLIPYTMH